ncbi:retropepsin-like aspartic protease [Thalassotalea ponticola]|uniref:retropepsin-like aspartic protease n=1 Tax=Thalassotalea ponticola TaxID=1523392 RepID=UPI0025B49C66|nr:retropepsin-like aspartic protease [Thalassotalea ponticola]MDN3653277.1 retropepsin-like aspartic protease [Thalassotalea ponticola]
MAKNKLIALLLLALGVSGFINLTLLKRQVILEQKLADAKANNAGTARLVALPNGTSEDANTLLSASEPQRNTGHNEQPTSQHKHPVTTDDSLYSDNQQVNLMIAKAQQFFNSYRFSQAVDLYASINDLQPQTAEQLKHNWLAECQTMIEQNRLNIASDFIDAMLHLQPFEYHSSLLQLTLWQKQGRDLQVLQRLIDLELNEFDAERKQALSSHIDRVYHHWSARVIDRQNWRLLIEQTERLLAQRGLQIDYIVNLVNGYLQLDDAHTALSYLQQIEYLADAQTQYQQLQQRIEQRLRGNEGIPLIADRDHLLVDTTINNALSTRLMIDTGASLTVISERTYAQLTRHTEIPAHREMMIRTASGEVEAFSIIVEQFAIGPWQVRDLEVVVMPLTNMTKTDGLLGMNFLRQFVFNIDQQQDLLFLQAK